ncbi:DUF523 domain-containing protein [Clostridioides sp. ES-S-0108-01]|uniref:DUF523 domain-containing protein n=1 Tax=Clostridioides sp. ES-S-0108-01 TaxID=2770773 RepID=UPI001D0CB298|nr:DUF523 domain-containing protein [Clostridioides sp. ES-S-0108-01]UDN51775.1 DUF523 domain-containing protein [Clostridioides sp. ES-S-0107-01]
MILVSACLIGINCKYSGDNNENEKVKEYLKDKEFTLVCPEQLGGLSTPRPPAEIVDGKVITKDNKDVTENFVRGAKETLKIANLYVCSEAILKEGSPSCGCNLIYDGSFSGKKIPGKGITARLLEEEGIKVKSEKDL